ncbi:extracellular solute-binding protein [Frankia sp. CNm7]|nr:extracellular solute-binding protein [Frankia nepalensis]MBL7515218.1 extracellular solute-binding protein [Frankia nepalensis]MBL7518113.1 extracellular solute-binding protein [Frankia nepalensis]
MVAAGTAIAGLLVTAAACGDDDTTGGGGTTSTGVDAAKATSLADFGGLDGLIAAAKAEGELNVIALPPDWANYGELIDTFSKKYGIKVNSDNPNGSSADELTAVKQLKGQDRAPDVLDIGTSFALTAADEGLLAPYQVATWDDIPDELKEPTGLWFSDYGGYVSIGYDANVITTPPTSFADLTKPEFKNKVAIDADPTQAAAAFAAVFAAALANGGSVDNILPGVEYFAELKRLGNFVPTEGTPATIESGQTPVLIWWDYLNAGVKEKIGGKVDFKVVIPSDGLYASYYTQAISATAPHPAAARLWQEFLYSDEGQNLWLKGLARPVRLDAMTAAGTVDPALAALLPKPAGEAQYPTQEQQDAAKKIVNDNWAKLVGGA